MKRISRFRASMRIAAALMVMLASVGIESANAQLPRTRATQNIPAEPVFFAPTVVVLPSTTSLAKYDLNISIFHSFGLVSSGIEELYGLDAPANIRFGFDYGLTDRISVGVGRSRFDKVYDFRAKGAVMRQSRDGGMPVNVSVTGDIGITTLKNGADFKDRLNMSASVLVSRSLNDRFGVQIAPTWTHFETVDAEFGGNGELLTSEKDHLAIGLSARYSITELASLAVEFIPVIGDRTENTRNVVSISLNMDTGGHVFQLFLTTTQGMTPQHAISRSRDVFQDGDVRIGFNINRVFGLNSW